MLVGPALQKNSTDKKQIHNPKNCINHVKKFLNVTLFQ